MDLPFFCDLGLARRIEGAAIRHDRFGYQRAAEGLHPEEPPAMLEVDGGVAIFNAPGSVLNTSFGLGLHGPVLPAHLDELEAFFVQRGERPRVEVCPLADPSLPAGLAARGYLPDDYENQLVASLREPIDSGGPYGRRSLDRGPDPRVTVREITPEERSAWGDLMMRAFEAPADLTAADIELGKVIAQGQEGVTYLLAEVDGAPAGTGMVTIAGEVALLNADATLPEFRGLGIQSALQGMRLDMATDAGCELATSEAAPGSVSQRNQERHGLRVAYTRTTWVRALKAPVRPAALRG